MSVKIIIVENPFKPTEFETLESDDVLASIAGRFPTWPSTARIFDIAGFDSARAMASLDPSILAARDVTPRDDAAIERLGQLSGPLMITVAPAGPIPLFVAIASVIISIALVLFFMPKIPNLANQQAPSPNNALTARTNQARPNGRIPDIFGTVRSVPDLIAVPYSQFVNNIEFEIALMCIGRGSYDVADIRDDTTPVGEIPGTTVQVYGPGKSPNNSAPDIRIGALIDSPMYNIRRSNGANGQTLNPINAKSYQGSSNVHFGADYTVRHLGGSGAVWTSYFAVNDMLVISGSSYTSGMVTFNGDGSYLISAIDADVITLTVTGSMVTEWAKIAGFAGAVTGDVSADLYVDGDQPVGPIIETVPAGGKLILNFVALNGLFKDDGTNQYPADVEVKVSVSELNSVGAVIGGPVDYNFTLPGSATLKTTVALTATIDPGFIGISSSTVTRVTPKDTTFKGTVVDEVKLRDFYLAGPVTQSDFGNVTTLFVKTIATAGALVIKDRKLNLNATRQIGTRLTSTTWGGAVAGSNSADDIFCAICTDPYIGARPVAELDLDSIYGAVADVSDYFANTLAKEFGYTFDNDAMSFEETAAIVAQAAFCTAYRQGRQFKLSFERATQDSVMLFNARNTVPASQKRTIRFGILEDHDGAVIDYVDPTDGSPIKFYIPVDQSATSPMSVDIPGVRSEYLANLHTWRVWNRMQFQNIALEFDATQEAILTIRNDRVLAVDLTRPQEIVGGEIEDIAGVRLTLTDDVFLDPAKDYSIYIQHIDNSVEILGCFPTAYTNEVDLSAPPRMALSLDPLNFTRAKFMIMANDDDAGQREFLVSERTQASPFTQTMSLINYSFLYYQNDQLELWLDFGFTLLKDSGPYQRDGLANGDLSLVKDDTRGYVFEGGGPATSIGFLPFAPPASYTKAVWIKRSDLTTAGSILGNSHETFGYDASALFLAGHGGSNLSATVPAINVWYHLAVTYDSGTGDMILYFNGEPAASTASAPARTLSQLTAMADLVGRATDLRLWHRALTAEEVESVYRSPRIDAGVPGSDTIPAGATYTAGQVVLSATGAGTWAVPPGFNPFSNVVELIGGGGAGAYGDVGAAGSGGGGGQYARTNNLVYAAGDLVSYHVAVASGAPGTSGSPGTGDTWFDNSASIAYAQGGHAGGRNAPAPAGDGGHASAVGACTVHNGGYGPTDTTAAYSGTGGGGAGGPDGAGSSGGGQNGTANGGGAGGGAANSGGAGAAVSGTTGGDGGTSRLGGGAGAGAAAGSIGGDGTSGGGGGGGGGSTSSGQQPGGGGKGSTEVKWGTTYGPGGGGGAGGEKNSVTYKGADGGNGGTYGGGGGGGAFSSASGGAGGAGGQGLIVITWFAS